MKTALFFMMLFFATCTAQKHRADAHSEKGSLNSDLDLTFVAGDSYSGQEEAETRIITDAKSLQKFYSQINRTRKPGLPVPDIDFSKDLVVVRCSGIGTDDALPKLYVREVAADSITLGISEKGQTSTSSAKTSPFAIYRMTDTQKEILIQE